MKRLITFFLIITLGYAVAFAVVIHEHVTIGDLAYNLTEDTKEAYVVMDHGQYFDEQGNPLHNNYVELPEELTIPESVEYNGLTYTVVGIGVMAFHDCERLTTVNIPKTMHSIDITCFLNCTAISAIYVDAASIYYFAENGVLYSGDKKNLVYYPQAKSDISVYTIPNGVERILDMAVKNTSLDSIYMPNSVTTIGVYSFSDNNQLRAIRLSENLQTIGQAAFSGCDHLLSITIPASVTEISRFHTFALCKSLKKVTINSPVIGGQTYTTADNLTERFGRQVEEYVLAEGITQVGEYAFYHADSLKTITIPSSVESIATNAFEGCEKIKHVNLNSNAVINVKFNPNSYILAHIFGWGVEEYVLGDAITSIGKYAFYNCANITSIRLPEHLTSIGESAFEGCTGLTGEFVFPEGIEVLNYYVIRYCSGITSVRLPNTLKEIWGYAFHGCTFTELTLPASLTGIDWCGLANAPFTTLTCLAVTPPELGMDAFLELDRPNIPLYVPAESVEKYKNTAEWNKFNPICAISNPEGVEDISMDKSQLTNKILKDGQVLILRGGKTYTSIGQEVK